MTRKELRDHIAATIEGVYNPEEARTIAYNICDSLFSVSRKDILVYPNVEISNLDTEKLKEICTRLLKSEPLQYITGVAEFHGIEFNVANGVLIPRPETEELVSWIVNDVVMLGNKSAKILDIGTGSGAIAVSLAKLLPDATLCAVDISEEALSIARENAIKSGVEVSFAKTDILSDSAVDITARLSHSKYDIIVSNPPYIPSSEYDSMRDNVRLFEPSIALFVSDVDPFIFYRSIAERGIELLNAGGYIYFEIHENFADDVSDLLKSLGYKEVECRRDFNDKIRMVRCRK